MAAEATGVLFKKPKTRRNLRKVDKAVEPEEDGLNKDQLEEVKLMQKRRAREKGVTSVADVAVAAAVEAAQDQKILGQEFDQQQVSEKDVQQAHMEKYIAEQMALRRKGPKAPEQPKSSAESDEAVLYKTPEIRKNAKPDEEVTEAGDRWLTGIAEVPLPISDKLKTIEETEKAKERLLAKQAAGTPGSVLPIPTNYSADFSRHQKEYAERRREQFKAAQPTETVDARRAPPQRKRPADVPAATDDRAVSQFLKRVRWH